MVITSLSGQTSARRLKGQRVAVFKGKAKAGQEGGGYTLYYDY